jgi:hypothetical protein
MLSTQSKPIVAQRNVDAEVALARMMRDAPMPDSELAQNAALYMAPRTLKRMLFLDELYRTALEVHGTIMQFGVRWGRDLAVFDALRTIYEPFNISRNIIGFDTFEGFPSVDPKDGCDPMIVPGGLSTVPDYAAQLANILDLRARLDPLPELKRWEICKGDAQEQLREYLQRHPETIVSLAYFDLDIYEPTKGCLKLLKEFLTKGSVLAFDELNFFKTPGETLALKEVFPLNSVRIRRSTAYSGQPSFFVIE